MRDPERKARIIKLLRTLWLSEHNDVRLIQLLYNITDGFEHSDGFFYEDDRLEKILKNHIPRKDKK